MSLKKNMTRFRAASREMFNQYFLVEDPWNNNGWVLEERFSEVEAVLFDALVARPSGTHVVRYGELQPEIQIVLKDSEFAPIMINRETDSGYWDFPITEMTKSTKLSFIRFFDWDLLALRDNHYVRARINEWPERPECVGKHALVEVQYIAFQSPNKALNPDAPKDGAPVS
jgi:hypothetical protein